MTDMEKINMAIAKLQAAGDIALVAGCELAKIPVMDALDIADLLERLTAEATVSARNVVAKQTEIVRCKHCRHYNTACCGDGCGWCERHDFGTNDEWYCADGEGK